MTNILSAEQEKFWEMLENNRFVKSTDSITDREEILNGGVVDMEAIVKINGEFDKYAIDAFLLASNQRVRHQTLQEVQGLIEEVASDPPLESNERRRGFQEFAAKLSALIEQK